MSKYWTGFGAVLTFLALALGVWLGKRTTWPPYAVWLVVWNIVSLAGFALDKLLSAVQGPRIPEAMLHLLSLLGGFAGAGIGMVALRHKSNRQRHPWFVPVFVLSSIVHSAALYWLLMRG